ncbi:DUF1801 domain-containing protein [Pukyongiella litopenaei]|uniref:DUF1801 domain-containing protein n=1 Tax=Pukyongiella litopenaei TaxID=2605946 RepID=A0A2S0MUJ2_9RHOB|nr:DUF1801 domain-containing protein [Pukyongiella litopenaei]AVO39570.1 DUF1801 domain-containing protein [Pukyongiella litopenaei]
MSAISPPFQSAAVEQLFARFPDAERAGLLGLRRLIFDTAAGIPDVGRIEEALRWGQPAYLTPDTGSGSTIRLGLPKAGGYALYVHCQTTILPDFRSLFPDAFDYEGNRAVLFRPGRTPDDDKLRLLIAAALTYHLR